MVASASVVAAWLAASYELEGPVECELFRPGWPTLYRIEHGEGIAWLRVFASGRPTLRQAEAQACAILELSARAVPVAPPIVRRDRALAGVLELAEESVAAILFANAAGGEPRRPEDIEAFGESLARFHVGGLDHDREDLPVLDAEWLCKRPLSRLVQWSASAPILEEVRGIADRMIDRAWGGGDELPTGLCHGDAHLENARVSEGRVTLFDLDMCCAGPIAYDLACCWRQCLLGHDHRDAADREWQALLRGYSRVRPVAEMELRAIPALAVLRAIWTMAMPTQFTDVWGTEWLRDPSYFEAHLGMIRRIAAVV